MSFSDILLAAAEEASKKEARYHVYKQQRLQETLELAAEADSVLDRRRNRAANKNPLGEVLGIKSKLPLIRELAAKGKSVEKIAEKIGYSTSFTKRYMDSENVKTLSPVGKKKK